MDCVRITSILRCAALCFAVVVSSTSLAQSLEQRADRAMFQVCRHFHAEVAVNGGYVYYYSPDLSKRLGEGVASRTEVQ